MKAIGIKINIQNYDASTFFGTNLPSGTYQIGEFAWVATPFVSSNQSIYCSYTNTNNCGQNWTHSANAQVDTDMKNGAEAAEHVPGGHGLQQGRRHPVAEHGHPAAVPEAAVLGLEQQAQGCRAQHLERRRHLERRELDDQLVRMRRRGRPPAAGPFSQL